MTGLERILKEYSLENIKLVLQDVDELKAGYTDSEYSSKYFRYGRSRQIIVYMQKDGLVAKLRVIAKRVDETIYEEDFQDRDEKQLWRDAKAAVDEKWKNIPEQTLYNSFGKLADDSFLQEIYEENMGGPRPFSYEENVHNGIYKGHADNGICSVQEVYYCDDVLQKFNALARFVEQFYGTRKDRKEFLREIRYSSSAIPRITVAVESLHNFMSQFPQRWRSNQKEYMRRINKVTELFTERIGILND